MIDRIRRLFVCTTVLGCLLLLGVGKVEAQCSPNPCYTANPPVVTRLTPGQYAAQGDGHTNAAVTMNFSAMDGSKASHNLTVGGGTQVGSGTNLLLNWKGWNLSSPPAIIYKWDYQTTWTNFWYQPTAPSGTYSYVIFDTNEAGHVMNFKITGSGLNPAQDVANVTVTSQAPAIYNSDNLPDNLIAHFHASGGGGSMLNDFTMCQLDPRHCINATHTPYTTLTVSNLMSGESQNHLKHISGNIAKQNESVSFSDDMFFSALPEDVFTYSEDDEVDCSISGPVGVPPVKMDIRFERAITEEYISSIINSNGQHPEHIYCIIAATPPDFPGADEALPGTPSGQVVNIAFLYREWPIGTQEKGVPWQLVFPDIQEFGIGYYVKTTMEPDPSGCTMWDNGFRHLPLPTPLDPQPQ